MITGYYSVYDKKAQAFGQLFPSVTKGSAERAFTENVNTADSMANKYPDDFALYQIHDFDDDTGQVVNVYDPPLVIVEAMTVLKV